MGDLKLGLAQGYWAARPNPNFVEMAQEAEKLGYDSVWSAESWGNDAFTPLCWIGAQTQKIKLGTAVVQLSARTPASCAMHALSLDLLSNGRFILGLGVSGPPFSDAMPVTDHPDNIRVLVAGGAGKHSCVIPSWGMTKSVTLPIEA